MSTARSSVTVRVFTVSKAKDVTFSDIYYNVTAASVPAKKLPKASKSTVNILR